MAGKRKAAGPRTRASGSKSELFDGLSPTNKGQKQTRQDAPRRVVIDTAENDGARFFTITIESEGGCILWRADSFREALVIVDQLVGLLGDVVISDRYSWGRL
jgi:hypothetical protein